MPHTENNSKPWLLLVISGILAGLCNGLLGSGGGIVLYFALSQMHYGSVRDRFVLNIAVVTVLCLVSSVTYRLRGSLQYADALPYIIQGVAGGAAGAFLSYRMNTVWLRRIFAVLVLYAGIRMLTRG